ncbi:hypothetical protein [Actinoplanes sp. NPDC051494]|uniref:hypothetical protein n=1 Tax=Actinoplanes sp. NPDC051494 TaxID=3363907 RepID=UPI0037B4562D
MKQLVFPDRYESLVERLGPEVAKLLVSPQEATRHLLEDAAFAVRGRREGALIPLYAASGTGKTTLANNLGTFFPGVYTDTLPYNGAVVADELRVALSDFAQHLPVNDTRVIPINIDHREGSPPDESEMAELKRFLRSPQLGARCAVLWPDTSASVAQGMARAYEAIAGTPAVEIPVAVEGPPRESWQETASNTLRLSNDLDSLEDLGVDPRNYDPAAFKSIGAFLRKLSDDFRTTQLRLLRAVQRPLRLAVVFVSESSDAGVLVHLTSSTRFGLLDGHALLDATKTSEVGKWWSARPGLLTQTIVQLDARAFCLPPTASVGILRRYGDESIVKPLMELGIKSQGESRLKVAIDRADLGKYLLGQSRATYEVRGTPSTTSIPAFQLLAETGFTAGADKRLNKVMGESITKFLTLHALPGIVASEQKLDFCPLIPDNSVDTGSDVICIEYTWRSGDFLRPANRAAIAQYCLAKMRNYCRELGWVHE